MEGCALADDGRGGSAYHLHPQNLPSSPIGTAHLSTSFSPAPYTHSCKCNEQETALAPSPISTAHLSTSLSPGTVFRVSKIFAGPPLDAAA
jgi:hypothetical protein